MVHSSADRVDLQLTWMCIIAKFHEFKALSIHVFILSYLLFLKSVFWSSGG